MASFKVQCDYLKIDFIIRRNIGDSFQLQIKDIKK